MAKIESKLISKKNLVIFSPSIDQGGVEKNLFLITEFLSKRLPNISLITSNFSDKKKFSKKIKIYTPPKYYWNFRNRLLNNLTCTIILLKLISSKKKFSLLSFNANIFATIVAKIFSIKVIVRINTSHKKWSTNFFKRFIFKFFLKYPDEVVVNSRELKKEIDKEFGVNSECIYNPLNKSEILKSIKTKKNIFGVDKKTLKILFIGRLVDQKDPFTFLKAIKDIPENIKYKSFMVGSGYLKEEILKFIRENNLGNKLIQVDYTKRAMQYLNQCDLFILSSKFEGLPNVLLEAQFLKKFIISSNCPTGPKEILLNGKAGDLIDTNSPKVLTQKIINFHKDKKKKLNKKKILLGYNQLQRFDFNINCKKYLNLIKRII